MTSARDEVARTVVFELALAAQIKDDLDSERIEHGAVGLPQSMQGVSPKHSPPDYPCPVCAAMSSEVAKVAGPFERKRLRELRLLAGGLCALPSPVPVPCCRFACHDWLVAAAEYPEKPRDAGRSAGIATRNPAPPLTPVASGVSLCEPYQEWWRD